MTRHIERTYSYTCDYCGEAKSAGELWRIMHAAGDSDLCEPCLSKPLRHVLAAVGADSKLYKPYEEDKPQVIRTY